MLKKLKFLNSDAVYISSDFHLGHKRDFIYGPRGYNDAFTHTNDIILTINNTIATTGILIYNGDFCLNTTLQECLSYLGRINCQTIYMLWGNHNSRVSEIYEQQLKEQYGVNDVEIYPLKYKNIIFVGDYLEINYKGQEYVCTHYPLRSWNSMSHGAINCYGHVHSKNEIDNGRAIDVGWDAFGKPLKLEEVNEIMKSKPVMHEGHH